VWGNLRLLAGTTTAPTLAFDTDTNTGMWQPAADQVGFSTGGVLRGRFWSGGLLMGTAVTGVAQISSVVGGSAAPTYSFFGDEDTGMSRGSEDQIVFACGGVTAAYFTSEFQTNILGAYNSTTAGTNSCQVDSNGRLQRFTSALKYKANIAPIPKDRRDKFFEAAGGILYTSLCEDDDKDQQHVGLVADYIDEAGWEELICYNPDDKSVESLKYDRIVALLVDEVKELRTRLAKLEE
jgi:hypothetical protein